MDVRFIMSQATEAQKRKAMTLPDARALRDYVNAQGAYISMDVAEQLFKEVQRLKVQMQAQTAPQPKPQPAPESAPAKSADVCTCPKCKGDKIRMYPTRRKYCEACGYDWY